MELAPGTAAVEFAALAAQEIEGAWDHGLRALEGAGQGGAGLPELLPAAGDGVAHVCILYIYTVYRLQAENDPQRQKPVPKMPNDLKSSVLRDVRPPSPSV